MYVLKTYGKHLYVHVCMYVMSRRLSYHEMNHCVCPESVTVLTTKLLKYAQMRRQICVFYCALHRTHGYSVQYAEISCVLMRILNPCLPLSYIDPYSAIRIDVP